jgi:hypothetical protein
MKRDDYIAGGHHFWVHFWCGLVVGAGLGAWISSGLFDSGRARIAMSVTMALVIAFCCGRWGDRAWEWIVGLFWWF